MPDPNTLSIAAGAAPRCVRRKPFYDTLRASELFAGHLLADQVAGLEALLDAWDAEVARRGEPPYPGELRGLAYILATAYHETGRTMLPVRELGRGRGRTYGQVNPSTGHAYYGRGYVQLTWFANYARMGRKLGLDLVNNPDLCLQPAVSARIIVSGMWDGNFTGHKLADCFSATADDPVGARRIVNGQDCADRIAEHYDVFLSAIDDGSIYGPPEADA